MINSANISLKIKNAYDQMHDLTQKNKQEEALFNKAKQLILENNVCMISHYYVPDIIQKLAEDTGGMVGDSLAMARYGKKINSGILLVAGVRFMGESAKILSPNKKVLVPTLQAECSLDLSCTVDELQKLKDRYPDRLVVVYVNTSAQIKAMSDWTVTSSNALQICKSLHEKGHKLIWAPDVHLGSWIRDRTGADMVLYDGACIVHEEFKAKELGELLISHPEAAILVHPESPREVVALADVVGSTAQLIKAAKTLPNQQLIVATDSGIFYKMQEAIPDKVLIPAPTAGIGSECKACAKCPWMQLNQLSNIIEVLEHKNQEIEVADDIIRAALVPLQRMVNFQEY